MAGLHAWVSDSVLFLVRQNKTYACLSTCVECFVQNLKYDDSPQMSYEHARFFLNIQYLCKAKSAGANGAHCRACRFCGGS